MADKVYLNKAVLKIWFLLFFNLMVSYETQLPGLSFKNLGDVAILGPGALAQPAGTDGQQGLCGSLQQPLPSPRPPCATLVGL